MRKFYKQSKNMKALEEMKNDYMKMCSLMRKIKRLKADITRLKAEEAASKVPRRV